MVDEQHKGVIVYYTANSCDSEEDMLKIVEAYLKEDIFAKVLYVDSGDFIGYLVAAPRHILEKHLKAAGIIPTK